MGEEVGSPGLFEIIEQRKDAFNADVFIGSVKRVVNSLAMTVGQRGT